MDAESSAPPGAVDVRWLTAFIDLPAESFDAGSDFWQAASRATRSATRGDTGQFATLIPPDGDPYLRVQRTDEGPRIHLDLHVDSVDRARHIAERLGAATGHGDADERTHEIMRSPTGLSFCFVHHHGESTPPRPGPDDLEHRIDQICIDVPADRFDEETAFWRDLTGWTLTQSKLAEFASLARPPASPLRLLFQRLGPDDGGAHSRAHIDVACGKQTAAVRRWHEELGAAFVHEGTVWTTMRDPSGLPYCLTQRDPLSGQIEP